MTAEAISDKVACVNDDRGKKITMIVLEGPDGSGKSTLARQLSADLNIPIAPRVVASDAEAMTDLKGWVDDNLTLGFQRLIFDRHRLISEMIYGPLLRAEPSPGFENFRWLASRQSRFKSIDPIMVMCIPPLEVVQENIYKDKDNNNLFRTPREVARLYWMYFNWTAANPQYLRYDYAVDSYESVLGHVSYLLERS